MVRLLSILVTQLLALTAVSLSLGLSFVQSAKAQAVDGGYAKVELISERAIAMPGERVWFGLTFEIDDGWHIYWRNAGDAGIPPEIIWPENLPINAEAIGAFEWPAPELLPVVPGEIMDYGYSGLVTLPFAVDIPSDVSGALLFEGVADYLICKDICIPESAPIRLLQSTGAGQLPDERGAAAITKALATVPASLDGEAALTPQGEAWILSITGDDLAGARGDVRFFPYGHEIVHAADQPVSFGDAGLQVRLTPASTKADAAETLAGLIQVGDRVVAVEARVGPVLPGTSGAPAGGGPLSLVTLIGFALIGGLILNLMPCVLPVLSIKAMGVVSAAASGRAGEARAHGLWYTAGVLVSFVGLAAAILIVRSATGIATWGFWLQDPVIVTALILILFLIGLWLLGLFELGTSIQGVGDGLARKQGSTGAFFTGVLAAVVGAPCTGPFLGAALGAVLVQPAPVVITVLLAMGLGLALPFLALSFVPGLQARMPKPGVWMETLKQVFAFPMFLTAAWLIMVIGSLSGFRVAAFIVGAGAVIAFGLWALRAADRGPKVILASVFGLALIVPVFGISSAVSFSGAVPSLLGLAALVAALVLLAKAPEVFAKRFTQGLAALAIGGASVFALSSAASSEPPSAEGSYSAAYPTEAWSPERVLALQAEGRPIFVDFTAEWCATCQANKLQTLSTRAVAEAFESADVAFLVADYTRPDPQIAAALQRYNRAGVPMYLWYPESASEPQVLPELLSVELVTGLVASDR
ncbi:MAG: thioredoxin family protein [Pseudomonadota bacterium]